MDVIINFANWVLKPLIQMGAAPLMTIVLTFLEQNFNFLRRAAPNKSLYINI